MLIEDQAQGKSPLRTPTTSLLIDFHIIKFLNTFVRIRGAAFTGTYESAANV
jgi:hypothetical protein